MGRTPVAIRRPWAVLAVAAVLGALLAVWGAGVGGSLSSGGYTDPAAESSLAGKLLDEEFRTGPANLVLLVRTDEDVDAPEVAAAGTELTRRLASVPEVQSAGSYWSPGGAPSLRSRDGRAALVVARLTGDDDQVLAATERIVPQFTGTQGPLTVTATGKAPVEHELEVISREDLTRAELIALPVTLVILLLVFGSAVAASLPMVIGVLAIVATAGILRVVGDVTELSVFALNLATALGLGLAIDYSLLMVNRFREELARGLPVPDAVAATRRSAGRTVVFSAVTVGLSLAAMAVFPLYYLRSFAYAGIATVAFAAFASLYVLPALMTVLGTRIDRFDVRNGLRRIVGRPPRARRFPADDERGFWHKVATQVMRRPVLFAGATVALLLSMAVPFLGASFGMADDRVLPSDAASRQAAQTLRDAFDIRESDALPVVLTGGQIDAPALARYASDLSRTGGVARVDAPTGVYAAGVRIADGNPSMAGARGAWLSVVPAVEPYSDDGARLVRDLRAATPPPTATSPAASVLVGGAAAELADTREALARSLPWAMLIIVVSTLVLLFLFTGSVLLPVKAVVVNTMSLTATFGSLVYVFQEGHLTWLVGDVHATGLLEITTPVLLFCVAFGLAMDYEVFLLARIKEAYDHAGDNTRAVALGLERTGRIVTAAALLVATVFVAFATSGITLLKMLGVGLTLAVLVDATVVRGLLVPAVMRLAGRANWWAPAPLRRLHARWGLADERS